MTWKLTIERTMKGTRFIAKVLSVLPLPCVLAGNLSAQVTPIGIGHTATNYGGEAYSVALSGNYAYVANYGDGLRTYDVSDPTQPVCVGHSVTNYGGSADGVAVAGSYAYLANYNDGLRIYDVSNPASPLEVGHTNNLHGSTRLAVSVSSQISIPIRPYLVSKARKRSPRAR